MLALSLSARVVALVVVLGVVSGVEWWIRRERAVRWRYSILVVLSGLAGAAFGAAFDGVTSSISPEYFALGKQLGWRDVSARAVELGARAGTSGGVAIGALLAYLDAQRRRDVAPDIVALLRGLPSVAVHAVVAAVLFGAAAQTLVSRGWSAVQIEGATFAEARRFHVVWAAHLGVYVGAAVGAIRIRTRPARGSDRG